MYSSSFEELASPPLVGVVDIAIEQSRRDAGHQWPKVFSYFNSEVTLPNFRGNYFDMIKGLYEN